MNPLQNSRLRNEYRSRINQVMDYIDSHLEQTLTLQELAKVSNFSQFHFHRIFSALVGETLNQFIQRIRLEKAAERLVNCPQLTITEIALDCGFSGSAVFARAFRNAFQMSPSSWRDGGFRDRKNCMTLSNYDQQLSKIRKAFEISSMYFNRNTHQQTWRIRMKQKTTLEASVEVKELPDMTFAYVRHIGPYKGDEGLFEQLWGAFCKWAGPRHLLNDSDVMFLTVYHDNPEITDESKLRISVGATVPAKTEVSGEIGKMDLKGGRYAIARFEIDAEGFSDAWTALYAGWLPESGYQPADSPSFEWYHRDPKTHPEGKFDVSICMPVVPI